MARPKTKEVPSAHVGINLGAAYLRRVIAYGKMQNPPKTAGELFVESFEKVHGKRMKVVMDASNQMDDK